jgi:hypothetical protein
MKKMLGVIVLSMGLIGVASAEERTYTIQEFGQSVGQIPVKFGNHLSNEIAKTKEFQAKNWEIMKAQFSDLISKFSRK